MDGFNDEQLKLVRESYAKVKKLDETWMVQGGMVFEAIFTLAPEAL